MSRAEQSQRPPSTRKERELKMGANRGLVEVTLGQHGRFETERGPFTSFRVTTSIYNGTTPHPSFSIAPFSLAPFRRIPYPGTIAGQSTYASTAKCKILIGRFALRSPDRDGGLSLYRALELVRRLLHGAHYPDHHRVR